MTSPGSELLFLALGGSGEIGMNVNLYGHDGQWLMVDCGATFADEAYPGIDIILPDLAFIEERRDALAGIVLTHGHEDHIGALAYFAADLDVPLYATPFTAGLIRAKLEEEGIARSVTLHVIDNGGSMQIGPFGVRYVPMAHSIPESNGLLIDTPAGRVFHTGDWKLDEAPVIGKPATAAELTAIGDSGITAMVCDSTNVFVEAPTPSEASVRDGLIDAVKKAKGRVVVTTFASNAARLSTLGAVAKATGRQLCVAGRSLDRVIRVGQATGYLRDLPDTVDMDAAMRLPPREVLIVATGGQGEPRAALARIAGDQHQIRLDAGDTVIFSSRQIPGNERAIGAIQNQLARKGVLMVTERQTHVHVSGHPGRPDLQAMYRWIRPEILVPVHGEDRHLAEHVRLGLSSGVPRAVFQTNGEIVRLAPDGPAKLGHVHVGRLVLDGDVILPANGTAINERRRIAVNGVISVAIAVGRDGRPTGMPDLRIQGLPVEEDRAAFTADAVEAARTAADTDRNPERQREAVRLAVRRCATRWTGKKPIVDVLVVRA